MLSCNSRKYERFLEPYPYILQLFLMQQRKASNWRLFTLFIRAHAQIQYKNEECMYLILFRPLFSVNYLLQFMYNNIQVVYLFIT